MAKTAPLPFYSRSRVQFAQALADALTLPLDEVEELVKPAEPVHGDFSFATFTLAKRLRRAPAQIASELAARVAVDGLTISAVGPYVNATFQAEPFVREVISSARAQGDAYGTSDVGAGKTIVIDYSSPNIAKPIAYHHIRSTVIGHALANLYRAQGYRVEGINYLGDWGKQFGLVATGLSAFGDHARRHDMAHLIDVYVQANRRAEEDPAFDERAREFFRRLEGADEEALGLWRELRETSVSEFRKIYERLGIAFEHYEGESRYQGKMDAVIEEISRTVGVKTSDGALIVDMPYAENEPPVLLKKSDGSTLYATRDIAAAIDRWERFRFERALYVIATDQALHCRQFFTVLERMGRPFAKALVHVNFGRVHGMSTRAGRVHLLSDVLDEAARRALDKVKENIAEGRMSSDDPTRLAEQIGVGAIVFGDLKNRRVTDYEFDWEDVLSFEGHSGPYLQYAHARACKILEKGGGAPETFDPRLLTLAEELDLVRAIARLPILVAEAASQNEPSLLARHLLELSAFFSRWYTLGNQERHKRVLVEEDPALRGGRLALTDAFRVAIAAGLRLLGVAAPSQM